MSFGGNGVIWRCLSEKAPETAVYVQGGKSVEFICKSRWGVMLEGRLLNWEWWCTRKIPELKVSGRINDKFAIIYCSVVAILDLNWLSAILVGMPLSLDRFTGGGTCQNSLTPPTLSPMKQNINLMTKALPDSLGAHSSWENHDPY